MVYADRTRFAQILMNYGSNAIKYRRPGGRAVFEVKITPERRVRITVADFFRYLTKPVRVDELTDVLEALLVREPS